MTVPRSSGLPEVTISESDGVRYLHLGTPWVQGAMSIRRPRVIVLDYVQRMMAWLLWRPQQRLAEGTAVQLGLGAAAITRFTHQVLRMNTIAVELNPAVIEVCHRWFRLPAEDTRLHVVQADAARWLRSDQAPRGRVTALCVDLYDHEAAAPVLDDEGFYADCRALLAEDGVMTVNLFGRQASFDVSAARVAAVFGAACVWSLQPTREGNTALVAARALALPPHAELVARAAALEQRYGAFGLAARKWPRMIRPWRDL